MEFKMLTIVAVLFLTQGINSKAISPFWGANPFFSPTSVIDAEYRPIVTEIQMRLSQAQAISKTAIGMNVGLASKSIGMSTSQAKTSVKSLVNNVQNNPNNTKECLDLNKDQINLLNTQSKNQLSFCSKNSQTLLKSVNQVQKEFNFQAATINQELTMAVSQCKLENPLPTDTTAVTDCVTLKADEIKLKVAELEKNILDAVQSVDTEITQIVSDGKTCAEQVQLVVQQQTETIANQLEQCSNTLTTV